MSTVDEQFYKRAEAGHIEDLQRLLRDHPEIDVNGTNYSRWTPLHAACSRGHIEVIKLLLAQPGINVNLKDSAGETPLFFACELGRVSESC